MKVYRIENQKTMHGMWYNSDGELDPFIKTLTEGISKDLPMEFDEKYGQNGKRWYSGCHDKGLLKNWFSLLDAKELSNAGYKLYEFDVTEYIIEEFQTIFTRESIISQVEIELSEVWKIKDE